LIKPINSCSSVTLAFACLLAGCASPGSNPALSVNHDSRVKIIVIHHTTADYADSYRILTKDSDTAVSSHYLIPEPGDPSYGKGELKIYQLVPESRRAWHAGSSYWSEKTGLNDQSIGIELVNQTYCHRKPRVESGTAQVEQETNDRICFFPDFADSQIALLVELLGGIMERHPDVKPNNIIGHSDIAPARKIDPGPRFPWQRLYTLGFGAWYEDETVIRYWEQFGESPLPLVNVQQALNTYGYRIDATGTNDEQTRNVLIAFQMHFRPSQVTGQANSDTVAVLFALIEKYFPDDLEQLLKITDALPVDSSNTDSLSEDAPTT
jgi:N-acetylmuramoyl-L-alanine amidase